MAVDFQFSTNYLVGRGKTLISDDKRVWYDVGNTPSFTYNLTVTTIEHKNSRDVVKVVDKEVTIEIVAEGAIALDTVHPENVRLFLLGDTIVEQNQAAAASQSNDLFKAELGFWKNVSDDELGAIPVDNIDSLTVTDVPETTTYALNTDYRADLRTGYIMPLATGAIAEDEILHVNFNVGLRDRLLIAAAKVSQIEKHFLFQGNPASGSVIDVAGFVNIKPEGDFGLVSDEFTAFTLNIKFLERTESYTGLLEHFDYGEV